MKTVTKSLRIVFAIASISILAGCGSNGGGYLVKTMSDKDYLKASKEEQANYRQAVIKEEIDLQDKKLVEYKSGRPVTYGDKKTGYTLQWDKKLSLVHIYPGHNNGLMGIEEESLLTLRSDENGNIKYQKFGNGAGGTYEQPTKFLANVATQEGLGRMFLKGGFQVGSAYMNGGYAADKYSDDNCGDNCGNLVVNNGSSSGSMSAASANTTSNLSSVIGCPTGNCSAPRK